MAGKIILTTFLMLFLAADICISARFNYSWKDSGGNLFITDYPPPDGAEIIEITIIPAPEQQQATPAPRRDEPRGQSATRSRLEAEAVALRKQETVLRQKAAGLSAEAEEQLRLGRKHHYKERFQRRAGQKEREAEELVRQADDLSAKAESLERQASVLK